MDSRLLFQISRPGLWLVFIWLYLWPSGTRSDLLNTPMFWLGLLYCTLPLNLLVYGINDMVDTDTDMKNSRKGNFIFGAKVPLAKLESLPRIISTINGGFIALFSLLTFDIFYIFWLVAAVAVNGAYNWKPFILSRRAPWEVPCMIAGHFLIPLLACRLNNLALPGLSSWIFHGLLLARSHLWLEMMDIKEDASCGKRTIAVAVGDRWTMMLILGLTAGESAVGLLMLRSSLLGYFSAFGAVLLVSMRILESQGIFIDKKAVSLSQSVVGFLLMVVVWKRGDLLV